MVRAGSGDRNAPEFLSLTPEPDGRSYSHGSRHRNTTDLSSLPSGVQVRNPGCLPLRSLRFTTTDREATAACSAGRQAMRFGRCEVSIAEGLPPPGTLSCPQCFVRVERSASGQWASQWPAVGRVRWVWRDAFFVDMDSGQRLVIADEKDLQVAVIDARISRDVLHRFPPGLATTFIITLALTLPQRLRELTVSLPPYCRTYRQVTRGSPLSEVGSRACQLTTSLGRCC